jgi:NTE family protein
MKIDGVFSGGGVKGIALLGSLKRLEERNIEFQRIAGTSVGSLIAALKVAGYTTTELIDLIRNDISFPSLIQPKSNGFFIGNVIRWLGLYGRMGLYSGNELEKFISKLLCAKGIYSFRDIPEGSLKIVVSDITNGTLVVLPDDLHKYGLNELDFPIAKAVRMSCSLPFFFRPVKMNNYLEDKVNLIVDGGVLSNFPMWLFEDENYRRQRPIIGLQLSPNLEFDYSRDIKNALQLFEALFDTMRSAHDKKYISKKHSNDIIFVKVEDVETTDFDISIKTIDNLIAIGEESATKFLRKWSY